MSKKKKFISILLILCMIFGMIPSNAFAANSSMPFTDVKESDWFYDSVQYVYENGMMSGAGNYFSPDATTTRGMIVTILHRMEGTPAVTGKEFSDVPSGQYYSEAVAWASANGIVDGYGYGLFGPNNIITREQLATILYRYAQYNGFPVNAVGNTSVFTDGKKVSAYAIEAMNWAVGAGLISGVGGTMLIPSGSASRAQVAVVLTRFCNSFIPTTYTVSFDYNYSNKGEYKSVAVKSGETFAAPAEPSRNGYTFVGWYTDRNAGEQFDFNTVISGNTTLYAKWKVKTPSWVGGIIPTPNPIPTPTPDPEVYYTVTFEANGDNVENIPETQRVKAGECAVVPVQPTRDGYTFDDWYTAVNNGEKYDFSTIVSDNITLYAVWTEVNVDEPGENDSPILPSEPTPDPTPDPEPDPEPAPEPDPEPDAGDDTYYDVIFNANGKDAENMPESQRVREGECAEAPASDPFAGDHIFFGWYTDAEGETIFDFETPICANTTLYANWIEVNMEYNAAELALRSIQIGYSDGNNANCVTKDLLLPSYVEVDGIDNPVLVEWSSNSRFVSDSGRVSRPSQDEFVVLTAEVSYEGQTYSRDFTVVVIAENVSTPIVVDSIEEMDQFSDDGSIPDVYRDSDNDISTIDGVFTNITVNSCEDAILSLESIKNILGIDDPEEEFVGANVTHSNYSNSYTVQQMYEGIPVYGRTIVVSTTLDGTPNYIKSGYFDNMTVDVSPSLNESDILNMLSVDYNSSYSYVVAGQAIFSLNAHADDPVLTYVVTAYGQNDECMETLFVNADTGDIVYSEESAISLSYSTTGKGRDELGIEQTFPIQVEEGFLFPTYFMQDPIRNITIYTYWRAEVNKVKNATNKWQDKTAVSAYTNLIKVHDWYQQNLNWTSLDGNGSSPLDLTVHHFLEKNNACYVSSTNSFRFYDNTAAKEWPYTTAVGLDIMGHEYTHGVFYHRLGEWIPYQNASGAINEAYADIFGCFIEGDWVIGEDLIGIPDGLRNITNPHARQKPKEYLVDEYWVPYTNKPSSNENDRGGVHSNGVVITYAAYLMEQKGISRQELIDLWFESMGLGYNGDSSFLDVRLNVIRAAKNMGMAARKITVINQVFDQVNIKLSSGTSISGRVTLSDDAYNANPGENKPLKDVRIWLYFKDEYDQSGSVSAKTDSDGSYVLSNVPSGIRVESLHVSHDYEGITEIFDSNFSLDKISNGTYDIVLYENTSSLSVSITIAENFEDTDITDNEPFTGNVRVFFSGYDPNGEYFIQREEDETSSGYYHFDNIPAGFDYSLNVYLFDDSAYVWSQTKETLVFDGTEAKTYDIVGVKKIEVTGQITNENGEPIENARVRISGINEFTGDEVSDNCGTDANGYYVIKVIPGINEISVSAPFPYDDIDKQPVSFDATNNVYNITLEEY